MSSNLTEFINTCQNTIIECQNIIVECQKLKAKVEQMLAQLNSGKKRTNGNQSSANPTGKTDPESSSSNRKPRHMENGHALEYLNAQALHKKTSIKLDEGHGFENAYKWYKEVKSGGNLTNLRNLEKSADITADFLITNEPKVAIGDCIRIQTTSDAKSGDVRDVIVIREDNFDVGISLKHKHDAVRHFRLPVDGDFGKSWIGEPVSETYLKEIKPIYEFLKEKQSEGVFWNQCTKKEKDEIYNMTLLAFETELSKFLKGKESKFVQLMLGKESFYQVLCFPRQTTIKSFNFDGNLSWGDLIKLPSQLLDVSRSSKLDTTEIEFNNNWKLSFRIHNAEGEIKPSSFKFDIRLTETPTLTSIDLSH